MLQSLTSIQNHSPTHSTIDNALSSLGGFWPLIESTNSYEKLGLRNEEAWLAGINQVSQSCVIKLTEGLHTSTITDTIQTAVSSNFWEIGQQIHNLLDPSLEIHQRFQTSLEFAPLDSWNAINSLIPKLKRNIDDFSIDEVVLNNDGSLVASDQTVTIDEINSRVSVILDSLEEVENDKILLIRTIFQKIGSISKPLLKYALISVIIPIVVSIISNFIYDSIQNDLKEGEKPKSKQTIVRGCF